MIGSAFRSRPAIPPARSGAIPPSARLAELADAWLAAAHDWSTGTKRAYRSVVRLSGMFALAIEDGAASSNPVRDSVARISVAKKSPRALLPSETDALVALFRGSSRARELGLPDLVDWMLATGCRIGEALALRHGVNAEGRALIDLGAGTWEVNATVCALRGRG